FINDDIGVINRNGFLFPNYAMPKIYGYNFKGYPELKNQVFSTRSLVDKFAWNYKKYRNGIQKVRRKISPKMFNPVNNSDFMIGKYFLLSRHSNPNFTISKISSSVAAQLTQQIIHTEYNYFYNHLIWHLYNSHSTKTEPVIDFEKTEAVRLKILEESLSKSENYFVSIPADISHSEYLKEMKKIIEYSTAKS
ncbi:MAG TPA: hypothetical protein VKA27_05180, partial [Sunxiuqinia sp.]|nr:hypothetical protein [Sunxiuqinia sp.]